MMLRTKDAISEITSDKISKVQIVLTSFFRKNFNNKIVTITFTRNSTICDIEFLKAFPIALKKPPITEETAIRGNPGCHTINWNCINLTF